MEVLRITLTNMRMMVARLEFHMMNFSTYACERLFVAQMTVCFLSFLLFMYVHCPPIKQAITSVSHWSYYVLILRISS